MICPDLGDPEGTERDATDNFPLLVFDNLFADVAAIVGDGPSCFARKPGPPILALHDAIALVVKHAYSAQHHSEIQPRMPHHWRGVDGFGIRRNRPDWAEKTIALAAILTIGRE